ncbi:MAG: aspartate:proton symporter, partial [Rhodanobacter sp.]
GRVKLRQEVYSSLWLMVYYALLIALSWLGTFGGRGIIGHPWDTVAVAMVGLAIYYWGACTGLPPHLLDLGTDDD